MFDYRLLALLLLAPFSQADGLLPGEYTILVNHALEATPGVDRRSVTVPLIERLETEDLPEMQRFLLGEVHFLNLDPEPARDAYWKFRDRDDDVGRVAWQRLMIIRINAFQMVEQVVENDIPMFDRRFGIRADDRFGVSFPVERAATLLVQRGEADKALDLITHHVRLHDQFDAPYTAYALPGKFFKTAAENGRADEFKELNRWVVDGLNKTIDQRLQNPPNDPPKPSELDGEIFFSLFADRKLDGYAWTAEFMKLRDRIVAGNASTRGRPGQ